METGNPYGVRPGLSTGLGTINSFKGSKPYMPGGSKYEGGQGMSDEQRRAIQSQINDLERTIAALKAQL